MPGNEATVAEIVQHVSLNTPFTNEIINNGIYSVCETIILFLDCLPDPVIPFSFFQRVIECGSLQTAKQIIASLPIPHYNVFVYLISFIKELLKHGASKSDLLHCFAPVILRPAARIPERLEQSVRKKQKIFLGWFL